MIAVDTILRWGKLEFDCDSYEAAWEGKNIDLTPTELYMLKYFMSNPHSLITPEDLIENVKNKNQRHVWSGEKNWPSNYTIKTHINNLRNKIKAVGVLDPIETKWGMGYRLSKSL